MVKGVCGMIGIVKFFDPKKGFGFVTKDEIDYFVHHSSLEMPGFRTVEDGMKVEFTPHKGAKGMEARDVKILR